MATALRRKKKEMFCYGRLELERDTSEGRLCFKYNIFGFRALIEQKKKDHQNLSA